MPKFLSAITLPKMASPGTPSSGGISIYGKADNQLYYKNDAGTEIGPLIGAANTVTTDTTQTITGLKTISPFATTAIGLIVKGLLSQTADLMQWQNSAGGVSTRVGPDGNFQVTGSESIRGSIFGSPSNGAHPVFIARGLSGQTGDLHQWQNNMGAVLSRVSGTGKIFGPNAAEFMAPDTGSTALDTKGLLGHTNAVQAWSINGFDPFARMKPAQFLMNNNNPSGINNSSIVIAAANTNTGALDVFGITGGTVPVVAVRGGASSSSDLTSWQNATGTVMAAVAADGNIRAKELLAYRGPDDGWSNYTQYRYDGIFPLNSSANFTLAANVNFSGPVSSGYTGGDNREAFQIIRSGIGRGATLLVTSQGGADNPGVVVRGTGSAVISTTALTANVATITTNAAHGFTNNRNVLVSGANNAAFNGTYFITSIPTVTTFTYSVTSANIASAASGGAAASSTQSGDLQQWQDSALTVLARIDSSGILNTSQVKVGHASGIESSGYLALVCGPSSTVGIGDGSTKPLEIRTQGSSSATLATVSVSAITSPAAATALSVTGPSGHTGDLTQWRNNTGAVLTRIASDGSIVFPVGTSNPTLRASGYGTVGALRTTGHLMVEGGFIWAGVDGQATAALLNTGGLSFQGGAVDMQVYQPGVLSDRSINMPGAGFRAQFLMAGRDLGVNPLATLHAATKTAVEIGVIARGSASQTADLTQWQNSVGVVLAKVGADGAAYFGGNVVESTTLYGVQVGRGPDSPRVVFSNGTSSDNWQIDNHPSGFRFFRPGGVALTLGNSGSNSMTGTLALTNNTASGIVLAVKAAGGQTADLTQWQNSTGGVIASVSAGGTIQIPSTALFAFSNNRSIASNRISQEWADFASNSNGQGLFGGNMFTGGSAGNAFAYSNSHASIGAIGLATHYPAQNSMSVIASDTAGSTAGTGFSPIIRVEFASSGTTTFTPRANAIAIVAKAATAQTADLTQWQDSAGTVLASVRHDGLLKVGTSPYLAALSVQSLPTGSGSPAIVVRQQTGQTALVQLQNSAGSEVGSWHSNGQLKILAAPPNVVFGVGGVETNAIVSGFRGATGQTADLTQWQNSAGTVLAKVSAAGVGNFANGTVIGPYAFAYDGNSALMYPFVRRMDAYGLSTEYGIKTVAEAGGVPLIVKTSVAHTANATEWQDSAGAVMSRISPSGQIFEGANRVYSAGNLVPVTGLSATGTRDATTFLRGDGVWAIPAGGAGGSVTSVNTRTGAVVGLAEANAVVDLTTAQTIAGAKSFTNPAITRTGSTAKTQMMVASGAVPGRYAVNDTVFTILGDEIIQATPTFVFQGGDGGTGTTTIFASMGPGGLKDGTSRVYSAVNLVPVAGLSATGTPSATTFLRGDNTWAIPAAPTNMVTTDTSQTITGVKTFTGEIDMISAAVPATPPASAVTIYSVNDAGGIARVRLLHSDGTSSAIRAIEPYVMSVTGVLTVTAGKSRIYLEDAYMIESIRASVNTAPAGASVLVDVNLNGTTVFTTQTNRPTIIAGANTGLANLGAGTIVSIAAGQYITVDVDQIGSTTAGSDLTVAIRLRRI